MFVRALEAERAAAALAALAALLLPASHPYGIVPFAVEAGRRSCGVARAAAAPALPTLVIALGVVPFLVADLRLLDRFSVGLGGDSLAQQRSLGDFAREVLGGLAAGPACCSFS